MSYFPYDPFPNETKEDYVRRMWQEKPPNYVPLAHALAGFSATNLSQQKNMNNSFVRKYELYQSRKSNGLLKGGRRRKTHRRRSHRRKTHRRN